MIKKVAVFNDISGFGRCSLTAALPVLSALSVQCNPIPTVVLTGQGGYTVKFRQEMTNMLPNFTKAWKENGVSFDGICTGYLSGAAQVTHVLEFLDTFRQENTFLLVDPVMGDNGRMYCTFSEEFLAGMKMLTPMADLITPNLTEACLLADEDFEAVSSLASEDVLLEKVISITHKLRERAIVPQDVVITGVKIQKSDNWYVHNVALTAEGVITNSFPWFEKSFSGTGDLFTSAMCGLRMNGYSTKEALPHAGKFIYDSISETMKEESDSNEGIDFERQLKYLVGLVK